MSKFANLPTPGAARLIATRARRPKRHANQCGVAVAVQRWRRLPCVVNDEVRFPCFPVIGREGLMKVKRVG